jgi:Putative metallopeptidase
MEGEEMRKIARRLALATALALSPAVVEAQTEQTGTFIITYEEGNDDISKKYAASLKQIAVFEALASGITETLKLPKDLKGTFKNCGEVNAFYDPAKREVTMCYELLEMLVDTAERTSTDDQTYGEFVMGAAFFFFLHEVGHALVDQLDLPITGKEEDAVDEIATLILLEGDKAAEDGDGLGSRMVAAAAFQFREMAASRQSMADLVFWDEHSLDAQRMYGILCLIYGSNPEANAAMVGEEALPQARARQCPVDYEKRARAWERLLDTHMKPDPAETQPTG